MFQVQTAALSTKREYPFCESRNGKKLCKLWQCIWKCHWYWYSRRIVNAAKHLYDTKGYGVEPCNKKGLPLETEIIFKVKEFYLSDEMSRVMPGAKDVKSIVVDGKRQHETVNKLFRKFIFMLFAVSNHKQKTFCFFLYRSICF